MQVTVKITKNYGVEAIYPTNEYGDMLLALTGRKTFSRNNIATIKALGFEVVVETETL